jgi:hypothetical protein
LMKTFFIRRRGVLQRASEERLANIVAELNRVVGYLIAESQIHEERAFQVAFAERLGNCHRELKMHLAAPALKPRRPSAQDIDECLRKGKRLPVTGRDPCEGSRRKLDVLWHSSEGHIPIELKFRVKWNVDTYGYEFLKDLHRLERLTGIEGPWSPAAQRFAIFVTNIGDYWDSGRTREPEPFRLRDGTSRPGGYWVQYNQPSAATRWFDYPPFYLANTYTFHWRDLSRQFKALVVPVAPQGLASSLHRRAKA